LRSIFSASGGKNVVEEHASARSERQTIDVRETIAKVPVHDDDVGEPTRLFGRFVVHRLAFYDSVPMTGMSPAFLADQHACRRCDEQSCLCISLASLREDEFRIRLVLLDNTFEFIILQLRTFGIEQATDRGKDTCSDPEYGPGEDSGPGVSRKFER
jgi:hypothetical protein